MLYCHVSISSILLLFHIQGFWCFARSQSREIHKSAKNTAKFCRNLIKYMSVQHIWNLFDNNYCCRGYLRAVNLQSYLGTSWLKRLNNVPKLPGVDYDAKNWALAVMLKVLPLVHFWSILLLKEQMMTSVRKTLKLWSDQHKSNWFLAKFALKITTKSAIFYRLLFGEVCPENSRKISVKLADFSANLSLRIPQNLTFSSATCQKPCIS